MNSPANRLKVQPLIILGLLALVVTLCVLLVVQRDTDHSRQYVDGDVPAARQAVIEWKMTTSWPKGFPGLGTAPELFAEKVREMSDGRLVVKVFGAKEIVPPLGVFDAVASGSVEAGHTGAYYWKGKSPATVFFTTIPFGMTAQEMNSWLHYGGGIELWRELYAPFNLVPMAGGNSGVQMAGWFNREINSIDDLKGLKMRIPGLAGEVFSRAGGTAVNIAGGDLYTSLKTGVIDATEWVGPYNDLAMGFHEVAKYYYYPGWHEPGSTMELIVNKDAYEALPDDLKAIVQTAARAVNQDMLDEFTARNNVALKQLIDEHGVELRRLPDDVLGRLKHISDDVVAELVASDPMAQKIYASYSRFAETARDYNRISESAYSDAREKAWHRDAEEPAVRP
ncbi:Monocarboxylate 2-oxoacid-binding periplasmic protein [BD1-7 clade bacterium]|uniref:Monocarboxylate 2-oxoacid-binding periplasmic protein n=1 Tax=BD1-7 clade bacterium TaxID=2029982 RepID=A0A5S9QB14_9GAMM|nr:Monocarboxylate 2-oxoacid-binding periplasmic protein [BD1-7 clade bacterium]